VDAGGEGLFRRRYRIFFKGGNRTYLEAYKVYSPAGISCLAWDE
jgi:hypothetical protein